MIAEHLALSGLQPMGIYMIQFTYMTQQQVFWGNAVIFNIADDVAAYPQLLAKLPL